MKVRGFTINLCLTPECKKIRVGTTGVGREEAKNLYDDVVAKYPLRLSHGYCPKCEAQINAELYKRERK